MTAKQIYEATAIELSKIQAPTLKLYEFNYFFNQAIRQYVNKIYNIYDINQQTTDDLRVLKSTATLLPTKAPSTGNKALDYLQGATYFVDMPDDYLHLLNCICVFYVNKRHECWNAENFMTVGATKLTADSWSSIVDDVYNRPTKKRPYYYIHNQNDIYIDDTLKLTNRNEQLPTNKDIDKLHDQNYALWYKGLDVISKFKDDKTSSVDDVCVAFNNCLGANAIIENHIGKVIGNLSSNAKAADAYKAFLQYPPVSIDSDFNFDRTFDFDSNNDGMFESYSTVNKPAGSRHANSSKVRVEIRCGRDKSNIFSLSAVQIDYVKAPQFIRLTQEQLDSDEDISQIMEFPDYVNQEIINELVNLIMRKTNDPSLNTHIQMTQSIARPTGQSQQTAAQA